MQHKGHLARKAFLVFRIIVSISILIYLVTVFDWHRVSVLVSKLRIEYAWPAPLLLLIALVFTALRWKLLLAHFGITLRLARAFQFYIVGWYYGIFLPGIIGGDVIRVGLCAEKRQAPLADVAATALIERVFGLLMVLTIGCMGLVLLPENLRTGLGTPVTAALLTVAGCILAAVLVGLTVVFYLPLHWLEGSTGWRHRLAVVARVLSVIRQIPLRLILQVALLSALAQTIDIGASWFIARSIHIDLPFSFFLVVIPVVYIGTVLPISWGGLGVREGILMALLTRVGEIPSDAVMLSFLIYLNRVFLAALGGGIQLVSGLRVAVSKERVA